MAVYVGDLLTASAAPVSGKPTPTRTWQWLRGSTAISGATSSTYTAVEADLGETLSVKQIETNIAGSAEATSLTVGPIQPFSPLALFNAGEEGAWYEPSTTTCFTDTGGTVAATYGDAVAYLQDKSGNGNHATQSTASARPILARVPEGGRRNLLERTEEFDNAYWSKIGLLAFGSGSVANTTATTDPLGGNTAEFIVPNTSNTTHVALKNPVGLSLIQYTISVYAKAGGYNWFLLANNQDGGVYVNLSDGSIGTVSAGFSNPTVTPVGNGWYRCSVTYTLSGASRGIGMYVANGDGVASFAGDGTSGIYIWGAQLEEGSSATAYQKVVDQYDVTEAGVTSLDYLAFDGADDFLVNTSLTHNATMDLSLSAYVETSNDQRDSIFYFGTTGGTYYYGLYQYKDATNARGFNTWNNDMTGSTPATLDTPFVDSAVFNNGVPLAAGNTYFRNGVAQSLSVITGTPASRTMTSGFVIGQGGSAASFQNLVGRIYGIVLLDRAKTTSERQNTEAYLAAKSGVTL